jgi:tellurite resistance protein
MATTPRDKRAELEKMLAELGLNPSTYRCLLLLPLVYVAWADGTVQAVERDLILDLASRRLHLTTATVSVLENWLKERPSRAYIEHGLGGLLGIALDEEMLEVDLDELPDLIVHAEALAAATADALNDPTSVTPEEEEALAEIARLLQVDSGMPWKSLIEGLRTRPPPADSAS